MELRTGGIKGKIRRRLLGLLYSRSRQPNQTGLDAA
jgi:hypothetical protein